ncbi:MAG: bifunctional GTP diphosphokinase/guanosine-3',5'-bis pyrophosphate 3'-pyrophosphohydrolase [Gammaproteobacteria bacterium]|nr:bifunctional GTP diphosphokinase/guanosine-3',5'-bis pyrophosphate 3'-pyrophosphohydrolase [Gammaproteobacteria bacterium]NIR83945.1 bifunctional GTP diphosphokinase/guanosine-3',5'-bis pyrophosphate 3'-pyrophosphohydrolase [Gammaproteobacteria bacterium]NIR88988.1 bifunctional GTP diphosphokinase/guanosine-3',5'-bis pyrophosphate 3'-pyrophosphohydrolase [Gammaproteobacteria bacterium]NIV74541.1 bifunctional GTP diphosphokinase/guanosine-3',5'-bis pyrophosphate 3'-pyrophosphohydrolase [Gammap
MFQIRDLSELTRAYLDPHQVEEIERAYQFSAEAHEGQRRASGEPYISHPIQVARILAEMRLDNRSIVAAILHDVIEDTPTAKEQIAQEFGDEVAELVDGVSKLSHITFESKAEAQAENFRKMLLAMARDMRVILVKLADRLHNMRTLGALPAQKRRQIARETLEIYAPIANRLGLNSIRTELEDLGFAALHPMRYRVLAAEVKKARGHRKQVVKKIETAIKRRLRQEELPAQVLGREKHLYSLYRKMRAKRLSFSEVHDVYAFRITVESVDACYRTLGAIHNLYKPVPGKFKDYIAIPKANGYQSLHTVLFGPYGVPLEVQIRTWEMQAVAESGIAAHWRYKTGEAKSNAAQKRARQWLLELLEMQKQAGNSIEFIENVKIDLFPDEVYVFTPAGDIMELPRGATAVDFAYAVHTDVGNTCVAVKIDRRYAPLRTPLATGQTVEVVTAPWGRPNPSWLNFVVTGKARSTIRSYLKKLRSGEAVRLGERLLNHALATESLTLDDISQDALDALVREYGLADVEALFEEIGFGKRIAPLVARRLLPASRGGDGPRHESSTPVDGKETQPLFIKGSEGMVVNLARCCHPIPGDPILGFVSTGRGIVVHTQSCHNRSEYMNRPEKWIDLQWESGIGGEFAVEIRIEVVNQKGVLATVAAAIAETDANIENVQTEDRDGFFSTLNFIVGVSDRRHLARIIRRLRGIREVLRITRPRG